ncbi:MAG TPA: CAP domain-containing protein [Noviherbaspirillum sp.]|uniref:CAP domain-containing protein n=1 Tax=Noviherbaspirillum sp. TaxID=1926288 RepID=UPI002D4338FB|nr:CAP domain-containing protein [Noviherbaspirillum sp.]HYD97027.1 CAP domain-containing protein [Noviherbaspirillum sp.]
MERHSRSALLALIAALALAACGGGGGGSSSESRPETASVVAAAPTGPAATGNTATDGVNWFNFRRQQLGLRVLTRTAAADAAAQGHSEYEKLNDVITHEQDPDAPGFTGVDVRDRLVAAGYQLVTRYAYGEVLSATGDPSGFNAAEDLIGAIYHRFVIFDPIFEQVGGGAATVPRGATYFSANFVTQRLDSGLGKGRYVVYPFDNQQGVQRNFFSDHEVPDPVPSRDEVGYPVSIHADITSTVEVQSFTIRPRGGGQLQVRLLQSTADPLTPSSAAAIIPLEPLRPTTVYDVQFSGAVDGVPVSRNWSFTTQ